LVHSRDRIPCAWGVRGKLGLPRPKPHRHANPSYLSRPCRRRNRVRRQTIALSRRQFSPIATGPI